MTFLPEVDMVRLFLAWLKVGLDFLREDFSIEGVWGLVVSGGGFGVLTDGEFVLGLDGDQAGGGSLDGVSVDGESEFVGGDFCQEDDFTARFFFGAEAGDLAFDADVESGDTFDEVEAVAVFFSALGEDDAVGLIGLDGGANVEGAVVDLRILESGLFFKAGFGLDKRFGVDAFGPGVPVFNELVFDDGVVLDDVVLLGAVLGKVVKFPGDFVGLAFSPDEFPVAFAEAACVLVFEGEDALGNGLVIGEGGEEGGTFDGGDFVAFAFGGIPCAGGFEDGGNNVHQVGRVPDKVLS